MSFNLKVEPYDIKVLKDKPLCEYEGCYIDRTNQDYIDEFIKSRLDCCRIALCHDSMTAQQSANSLIKTIKRFKYMNIKVIRRYNEVFLVKADEWYNLDKKKQLG